jgi:hypothetical protein
MEWQENRIKRFKEDQLCKREWINFAEIAEWYSELGGPATRKKAAAARGHAFVILERDLVDGVFEEGGRSRVLFLFPGISPTHWKMTRQWFQDARDNNLDGKKGRLYLKHCWLPAKVFEHWCARHHLPESPPRFVPQESHRVSKRKHLTQPFNKGGRPPKVDWNALKDAFQQEIKICGYPNSQNPPGWQRTKDVVDWAFTKLGKEGENVIPRTVADHVRRMLRELKASSTKPVSR